MACCYLTQLMQWDIFLLWTRPEIRFYCKGGSVIKLRILTLQRKIKAICTRADRKGSLYFRIFPQFVISWEPAHLSCHTYKITQSFWKQPESPVKAPEKIQWQLYEGLGKLSPFWMCCDTIEDGVLCHHRISKSKENRRWKSWTAFLVEVSGHKLESSQTRVFVRFYT